MAETRANGMYGIRKRYVDLYLSSNVVELIMNSWLKGTQKQYSPHINRWFGYCTRHNLDPFYSSVNQRAELLAQYFHEGASYSVQPDQLYLVFSQQPKDGTPFGKHTLILRLLRGMFNPFVPNARFLYPLKISENRNVF